MFPAGSVTVSTEISAPSATGDQCDRLIHAGRDPIVILDEAGMVDHRRLDALTLIAVGDGKQVPSIGPGGMFDRLAEHVPSAELADIHRTKDPARQRAWQALRAGEPARAMAHYANSYTFGSRRMWKALLRSGERVGRCRVERLMRQNGLQGARGWGKPWGVQRGPTRRRAQPREGAARLHRITAGRDVVALSLASGREIVPQFILWLSIRATLGACRFTLPGRLREIPVEDEPKAACDDFAQKLMSTMSINGGLVGTSGAER